MNHTFGPYTVYNNAPIAQTACNIILQAAEKAIKEKRSFVFSLAGGNTPKQLYSLLKSSNAQWQYWHLIYGDERFLPAGHPDRNSTLIEKTWLKHCSFPLANHHRIPDGLSLEETAQQYEELIETWLPIDFALLGIGADGHTASLFPENIEKDIANKITCIPVDNAPKPPPQRISLSYSVFNQAKTVCFIAGGNEKRQLLQQWQKNPALPCNRIHGVEDTLLITDQDIS